MTVETNVVSGFPVVLEYAEGSMPAATSVPAGTEVFNTTYSVKMRSNGTRWHALSQFVAAIGTPNDVITQASGGVEIVFRTVDISAAMRYVGRSGAIRFLGLVDGMTADAASKSLRIRFGAAGTVADTTFFQGNAVSSVGILMQCYVFARNSESAQISGNNSQSAGYFSSNSTGALPETSIDMSTGTQYATFSSAPATVGHQATLRMYRIVVEPGYV